MRRKRWLREPGTGRLHGLSRPLRAVRWSAGGSVGESRDPVDRGAVRASQDGLRGGTCVLQGSESESGIAFCIVLGVVGGVAARAGTEKSDEERGDRESAVVPGGSGLPSAVGSESDRQFEDAHRHELSTGRRPSAVFTMKLSRLQLRILRLLNMSEVYDI
jgi:hypothetical protein